MRVMSEEMRQDVARTAVKLHEMLEQSGNPAITIPDDELRLLANRPRIRDFFLEKLGDYLADLGYIFGIGDRVHIVSLDANYSPIVVN